MNPVRRTSLAVVAILAGLAVAAPPASAAYVWRDDDFITGGTAGAVFDGSWGANGDAMVRWWKDSDNSVIRGEIKNSSIVRVKSGTNPKCIAVRPRWQKLTGSIGFSYPTSAGVTVGITQATDGYTVSCRGSSGTATAIQMGGHAHSSRYLTGLKVDVCHKSTSTSLWACATDANSYMGA